MIREAIGFALNSDRLVRAVDGTSRRRTRFSCSAGGTESTQFLFTARGLAVTHTRARTIVAASPSTDHCTLVVGD